MAIIHVPSTYRKRAKDDDAAAAISTFQFKQLCSFSKLGQDTTLLPPTCTLETHRQAAVDMQASMDRQLKKTLSVRCLQLREALGRCGAIRPRLLSSG